MQITRNPGQVPFVWNYDEDTGALIEEEIPESEVLQGGSNNLGYYPYFAWGAVWRCSYVPPPVDKYLEGYVSIFWLEYKFTLLDDWLGTLKVYKNNEELCGTLENIGDEVTVGVPEPQEIIDKIPKQAPQEMYWYGGDGADWNGVLVSPQWKYNYFASEGGSVSGKSQTRDAYNYDSTITATPDSGYKFLRWTSGSGNPHYANPWDCLYGYAAADIDINKLQRNVVAIFEDE